jgi:UDP-glucose 4-epimerase
MPAPIVLVTGSAGRVGRAIVARLATTWQVRTLDRLAAPGVEFVGDLADAALLRRVLAGADAVVHVAALHAPHVGVEPDAEFERINVDGTRRLLDAAVAAQVGRIVFTSTTALYGMACDDPQRAVFVDESLPPQPRTIYHRTKLAAEALLREAARQGGPRLRILRMSRCFPEPVNVMAAFRLHRGIDARDVAEAHALALADAAGRDAHDTFVVSGPTPFLPQDAEALRYAPAGTLAARCRALVTAFAQRRWPLPASIDRVYSAQRARQVLGWHPQHGWDEVLRQFDAGSNEVLAADATGAWQPD